MTDGKNYTDNTTNKAYNSCALYFLQILNL